MGVFEQLEEIRKTPTPVAGGRGPTLTPPSTPAPSSPSATTPLNETSSAPVQPNDGETLSVASPVPTVGTLPPTPETPLLPTLERPIGRSPVRRTLTRHSFELFQDQVDALRRLALEEKLLGDKGNMSEMAREAMDAYLAKRKRNAR